MRKVVLSLALMLPFLTLFAGCGGEDLSAPRSTLTDAPDTLFFNNGNSDGTSTRVRFSGTATDNFSINAVQISFDNGLTWKDATISGTGSSKTWIYLAKESVPSAASTIRTKAQDRAGNWETPGAGTAYTMTSSSVIGSLVNLVSTASTNDVIYLSSGSGGAYSFTSTAIVNAVDLTIVGSGYGQALTTSSFSAVDVTPITAIASSRSSSYIFSVGANLTLKNLRISGSINAVDIYDIAGTMTFEDLVFEDFKTWAIYAEDTDAADSTVLYVSTDTVMIDATDADLLNPRGGIHMGGSGGADIDFLISNSFVKSLPALGSNEGGGIFVESSPGRIDSSVLYGNAVGIWFKNSSATLSSSAVNGGGGGNSKGIRMSGAAGSPNLRWNTISGNAGYDVLVGGSATPIFYRNTISAAGSITPGVWVNGPNAVPDLGTFPFTSSGCNQFLRELSNPLQVFPVLSVADTTNAADIINAGSNFWGFITYTGAQVHTFRITDWIDTGNAARVDLSGTGALLSPDLWNSVASCP